MKPFPGGNTFGEDAINKNNSLGSFWPSVRYCPILKFITGRWRGEARETCSLAELVLLVNGVVVLCSAHLVGANWTSPASLNPIPPLTASSLTPTRAPAQHNNPLGHPTCTQQHAVSRLSRPPHAPPHPLGLLNGSRKHQPQPPLPCFPFNSQGQPNQGCSRKPWQLFISNFSSVTYASPFE